MNQDVLFFFESMPDAAFLYEALEERIFSEIENVNVRVQKTQITFTNPKVFACASLLQVKKKSELPPVYLVVTFGLEHRVESPRIAAATEAYPNRWTHHVVIVSAEEIDEELMGWIREAAEFSASKGRKKDGKR